MNTEIRDAAIEKVFELEGYGGCIDPVDKGGLTCWGISQAANPDLDVKSLTKEAAKEIYIQRYWDRFHLDLLAEKYPQSAIKLFDMVVNMGGFTAIKVMQHALPEVKMDGIIGPKTLGALEDFDDEQLLMLLRRQGSKYYRGIVTKDPSQAKFLKGWLRRAAS